MIRIQQVKLPLDHTKDELEQKIRKILRLNKGQELEYKIYRRSLDARKKQDIQFVYHIDVTKPSDDAYVNKKIKNLAIINKKPYSIAARGETPIKDSPVIVGAGPSGLLCGLMLARLGYKPIILERGNPVEQRVKDVEAFWEDNTLNLQSNVQFGEGGAGTFSDGKLNTLVKDKNMRGRKVLEEFIRYGAPEEIAYINKPHIGTDRLRDVVVGIREEIIAHGGEVRFASQMTDVIIEEGRIVGVEVNGSYKLPSEHLVIGIGHSARDTFKMLHDRDVHMEAKAFAMGVRIEHDQEMINKAQYGPFANHPKLGAADYKLTHTASNGRGVYSFCMCPGGVVVASASEENTVVTNGMSYYKRDLPNANSALLVSVNPDDFPTKDPLAGVEFQRIWERKAFEVGGSNYQAPAQCVGDFLKDRPSQSVGEVKPSFTNKVHMTDLRECLPEYVVEGLKEGLLAFDRKIKGYAKDDAIMTGVETRSSSPVRIVRDKEFQSNIKGLYPMGEGAGYAGGIMSAAMDGLKIAEYIAEHYRP